MPFRSHREESGRIGELTVYSKAGAEIKQNVSFVKSTKRDLQRRRLPAHQEQEGTNQAKQQRGRKNMQSLLAR